MDDAWRIACHEAGHAIHAVQNGLIFEHVEVGVNEHGVVVPIGGPLNDPDTPYTNEQLLCWQTFYAAGAAAEHVLFCEIRSHAIRGDIENHEKLNQRLPEDTRSSFDSRVDEAARLLDGSIVQRVAEKLIDCEQLTYENTCDLAGVPVPWA